jgi:hypothetical protein
MYVAENLQKHVLHHVACVAGTSEEAVHHAIHRLLKTLNQLFVSFFYSGSQAPQYAGVFVRHASLAGSDDRKAGVSS